MDPAKAEERRESREMAEYDFVSRWFIDAPIARVFDAIEDAASWPSWWKAVAQIDVLDRAGADGIGALTRCKWRSAFGYTLSFDARVTKRAPPNLIEVAAAGELVGVGRWTLSPESAGTHVQYEWTVTTTKRWMNFLAPILRPAFRYNHSVVMRWGGEGLGRHLGARFEDRSAVSRDSSPLRSS